MRQVLVADYHRHWSPQEGNSTGVLTRCFPPLSRTGEFDLRSLAALPIRGASFMRLSLPQGVLLIPLNGSYTRIATPDARHHRRRKAEDGLAEDMPADRYHPPD